MPPLVRAGLAAALLATLAVMTDRPPERVHVGAIPSSAGAAVPLSAGGAVPLSAGAPAPAGAGSVERLTAICPRGTLPDGEVCVPVPPREPSARAAELSPGRRIEPDRIERRPDRPADFAKYRLPADGATARIVALEHQEGDAEVLDVGQISGVSGSAVVTLHAVRDAGGLHEYLAIFGNLARIEAAVAPRKRLRDGEAVGTFADVPVPGGLPFGYEIRRLRAGVSPRSLGPGDYVADARTVGCDARNVLPLH